MTVNELRAALDKMVSDDPTIGEYVAVGDGLECLLELDAPYVVMGLEIEYGMRVVDAVCFSDDPHVLSRALPRSGGT